ncbi:MAG: hypothetical protein ACXVP7_02845 [Actinomycetota bacterium]
MFNFRNVFAAGLLLFGSTFLWMTAAFAGRTPPPEGTAWTIENVLALLAVVGFTAAAWGVWKELGWWEPVAAVSAVVGLVAVVPYAIALGQSHIVLADPGVWINLVLHTGGSVVVLAIVAWPFAHEWVTHRL